VGILLSVDLVDRLAWLDALEGDVPSNDVVVKTEAARLNEVARLVIVEAAADASTSIKPVIFTFDS